MPRGPQLLCVPARGMRAPLVQVVEEVRLLHWTDEMQNALDELKTLISMPPVLASPEPGKTLLYIAATTQLINTAMVVEQEEPRHVYKVQRSVCYISKVLFDCETRYNQVQELLYAVLITERKLLHYFESHPILVVTSYQLREIIGNCLTTGRIANWALELMGLDITYIPQMTIKSEALANFVAEWTNTQQPPSRSPKSTGAHISMALSPSSGPGRHGADLSKGRSAPLYDLATLPRIQRCGGIRGTCQWPVHHTRAWGLAALYLR
jgi:hypothetical protein